MQDSALSVDWKQTWYVDENGKERPYSSNIKIYKFLNLVACEFTYEAKNGQNVDAQIVGLIDNGRFITGRWFNANDPSGYHGALQLRRSGDSQRFEGAWIGLSDTSGVKSGSWLWERNPHSPSLQ
ncbi:hypothetical protein A4A58_14360 [Tardiphaga robiniae]|uniref:Uncharacterized protein n=1 Tax=Tardiphaga robiniae TaxID=943830 RepID=A0A163XXT2_9BRAD|nr:hypothetical protein A4A58_14360 [Tardiphaga robiniae]